MKKIKIVVLIFLICGAACAGKGWVTPMRFSKMSPHPRLFVSQQQIDRMVKGRGEAYNDIYNTVKGTSWAGPTLMMICFLTMRLLGSNV